MDSILDSRQNNGCIKRIFDLMIAVPLLFVFLPVLVLIGFMVRMKIGTPVLFRQERPGKNGGPFTVYKFCTMTDKRDKGGNLLPDKERLSWRSRAGQRPRCAAESN
ncbi:sugar transferase [Thermodesulfovibrionales bacterium]|nr:sugar transferase [Thermodesulfovibrionales bacterium]